jgi:tetratricopeptide (TPR) repeat protein
MSRSFYIIRVYLFFLLTLIACKTKTQADPNTKNIVYHRAIAIKDKDAKELFEEGLKDVEDNDFQEAGKCFRKADKLYPDCPIILVAIGNCLVNMHRTQYASSYYARALLADSTLINTYLSYGACLNRLGRYDSAMLILNLGLSKPQPNDFDMRLLYLNLSGSYEAVHDTTKALEVLDSAKKGLSYGEFYTKIIGIEDQIKSGTAR